MKLQPFVFGAPHSTSLEALLNLKSINRELLIAAAADIPDEASRSLDVARHFVLSAIAATNLATGQDTAVPPAE